MSGHLLVKSASLCPARTPLLSLIPYCLTLPVSPSVAPSVPQCPLSVPQCPPSVPPVFLQYPHCSLWPLLSMAPLAVTLALLPMAVVTTDIKMVPLDMARDSFDDQYQDCGPAMTKELPALNCSEFQKNPLFAEVWKKAAAECQRRGLPESPLSTPQAIAIMAYTMGGLYEKFNEAVRTNGHSCQVYQDNFHYKTLHFLLTQALGTLRDSQGSRCHDVFRGVRGVLFKTQVGQKVRFGQFASTSLSEKVAQGYGTDTMFQVHTCHGANIMDFSYDKSKKEVLIPPFETFEVIEVSQEGEKPRIRLNSTGTYSKYKCEWLRGGSKPRAPFHLGGLLLASTALAVATRMP